MTEGLAIEIAELAIALVGTEKNGLENDIAATTTLLQLGQKVAQAYSEQAGQPLDPTLIKPEDLV